MYLYSGVDSINTVFVWYLEATFHNVNIHFSVWQLFCNDLGINSTRVWHANN